MYKRQHEHLACGDGARQLAALGGKLDDPANVADDHVAGVQAHLTGQLGVNLEHTLLAVDGNEVFGLDQSVDDLQLLLAGVARHVQGALPLVEDLCSLAVELVNDVSDGVLIARNSGKMCIRDRANAESDTESKKVPPYSGRAQARQYKISLYYRTHVRTASSTGSQLFPLGRNMSRLLRRY